eukprot:1135974-Pyramimonas_sp.AAC.1
MPRTCQLSSSGLVLWRPMERPRCHVALLEPRCAVSERGYLRPVTIHHGAGLNALAMERIRA